MGTFVGQCQQRHPGCDAHASVILAGGSPHFCTIAASVSKRISYDGSPACVAGRAAGLAVVVSLKWSALVARVVARETEGGREVCWRGGVGRERVGDAHVGDRLVHRARQAVRETLLRRWVGRVRVGNALVGQRLQPQPRSSVSHLPYRGARLRSLSDMARLGVSLVTPIFAAIVVSLQGSVGGRTAVAMPKAALDAAMAAARSGDLRRLLPHLIFTNGRHCALNDHAAADALRLWASCADVAPAASGRPAPM